MPSSGLALELLRSSTVVVSMELLIDLFMNIVEKYVNEKCEMCHCRSSVDP